MSEDKDLQNKERLQKLSAAFKDIISISGIKREPYYDLELDFFEKIKDNQAYKHYKKLVEINGCVNAGVNFQTRETAEVYTPELAFILLSKELPVTISHSKESLMINGEDFLKSYFEGYKEGMAYFDEEYKNIDYAISGPDANLHVQELHNKYYHGSKEGTKQIKPWSWVKNSYPVIFSDKAIKEYGYYSGIVYKIDLIKKKYAALFNAYDRCEGKKSVFVDDGKQQEFLHFLEGKEIIKNGALNGKFDKQFLAGIISRFEDEQDYFVYGAEWKDIIGYVFELIGIPNANKRVNKKGNFNNGRDFASSHFGKIKISKR
ncbi:MAG TPA: hypothetical protein VFW07_01420 [Parafilimonas sp.]|nr:hypothetical protein [Parafilimonas sp.]